MILRIFVMGLVALVPGNDGTSLTILVPQTKQYDDHRHYPVLLYPCDRGSCNPEQAGVIWRYLNLPEDRLQGGKIVDPGSRKKFGGFLLAGEDVAFDSASPGGLTFVQGLRKWDVLDPLGDLPKDLHEARDFGWVISMAEVSPVHATVASRHFFDPQRDELAAILTLSGVQGAVRTYSLATTHNGQESTVRSLTFRIPGDTPDMLATRGGLADVVVVEVPLTSTNPKITLTEFDGGSRDVELKRYGRERWFDLLLANLTPIYDGPDGAFQHHLEMTSNQPAYHFGAFYCLSMPKVRCEEGLPKGVPIPYPGIRDEAGAVTPAGHFPPVVQAVSRYPAAAGESMRLFETKGKGGYYGGLSRPICSLAILASP